MSQQFQGLVLGLYLVKEEKKDMTTGEKYLLIGMILMLVGGCCISLNNFVVMAIFILGLLLMTTAAFKTSE